MPDRALHEQIDELVTREKTLRASEPTSPEENADRMRELRNIEASLDQCWDLLRQRDALREFGRNPDEARVRPKEEVENYLD